VTAATGGVEFLVQLFHDQRMHAPRLLLCLSLTFCALSSGADSEVNPVRKQPTAVAEADVQEVIVKFRKDGPDV
jgi:hypothetical protein